MTEHGTTFSRTLFVTCDGKAIQFFVRPCADKFKLRTLIEERGGIVLDQSTPDCFRLVLPKDHPPKTTKNNLKVNFVYDCVNANKLLSVDDYRVEHQNESDLDIDNDEDAYPHPVPNRTAVRNVSGKTYTNHEDHKIIKFITKQSCYTSVKGNAIWKKMEESFDHERTWQSLKERYLKRIIPRLPEYNVPDVLYEKMKRGCGAWTRNDQARMASRKRRIKPVIAEDSSESSDSTVVFTGEWTSKDQAKLSMRKRKYNPLDDDSSGNSDATVIDLTNEKVKGLQMSSDGEKAGPSGFVPPAQHEKAGPSGVALESQQKSTEAHPATSETEHLQVDSNSCKSLEIISSAENVSHLSASKNGAGHMVSSTPKLSRLSRILLKKNSTATTDPKTVPDVTSGIDLEQVRNKSVPSVLSAAENSGSLCDENIGRQSEAQEKADEIQDSAIQTNSIGSKEKEPPISSNFQHEAASVTDNPDKPDFQDLSTKRSKTFQLTSTIPKATTRTENSGMPEFQVCTTRNKNNQKGMSPPPPLKVKSMTIPLAGELEFESNTIESDDDSRSSNKSFLLNLSLTSVDSQPASPQYSKRRKRSVEEGKDECEESELCEQLLPSQNSEVLVENDLLLMPLREMARTLPNSSPGSLINQTCDSHINEDEDMDSLDESLLEKSREVSRDQVNLELKGMSDDYILNLDTEGSLTAEHLLDSQYSDGDRTLVPCCSKQDANKNAQEKKRKTKFVETEHISNSTKEAESSSNSEQPYSNGTGSSPESSVSDDGYCEIKKILVSTRDRHKGRLESDSVDISRADLERLISICEAKRLKEEVRNIKVKPLSMVSNKDTSTLKKFLKIHKQL